MDILIVPLVGLIRATIGLVNWVIIADIVLNLLMYFNILNVNNRLVTGFSGVIGKISNFFLNPIRSRFNLTFGAIDFSPVVFLLFLRFVGGLLIRLLMKFA